MAILNPVSFLHNRTDHTAQTDRLAQSGLIMPSGSGVTWRAGVRGSGDLRVSAQGSPNMTVSVAAGQVYITQSSAIQGLYLVTNDAATNVTIAAAHATLSRRDLVIVRVEDSFFTGAVDAGKLEVVTGVASSSPSDPVVTGNYKTLARITVAPSVTTITSGAIADLRTRTVALGGILPVASTAERDALIDVTRGIVVDNDESNMMERFDGASWKQIEHVNDTGWIDCPKTSGWPGKCQAKYAGYTVEIRADLLGGPNIAAGAFYIFASLPGGIPSPSSSVGLNARGDCWMGATGGHAYCTPAGDLGVINGTGAIRNSIATSITYLA